MCMCFCACVCVSSSIMFVCSPHFPGVWPLVIPNPRGLMIHNATSFVMHTARMESSAWQNSQRSLRLADGGFKPFVEMLVYRFYKVSHAELHEAPICKLEHCRNWCETILNSSTLFVTQTEKFLPHWLAGLQPLHLAWLKLVAKNARL